MKLNDARLFWVSVVAAVAACGLITDLCFARSYVATHLSEVARVQLVVRLYGKVTDSHGLKLEVGSALRRGLLDSEIQVADSADFVLDLKIDFYHDIKSSGLDVAVVTLSLLGTWSQRTAE